MSVQADTRKSIKISNDIHKILKDYCTENGLKMEWYLDKLINENCKVEKDK